MEPVWDYIVVGAGSSGCVVAERLSADGKSSVLVLEAGGENDSFWVTLPKGVAKLVTNPRHVWAYPVSQARGNGGPAGEVWIRGKGLGGSSSVNGMIWSRGEPADYDAWEAAGATGWNGAAMTEAFLALEDHAAGPGPMRGSGGLVHVDPAIYSYPLTEAMIGAGEAVGLDRVDDLNGTLGPRVGLYTHNIRKGQRQSSARTFLAAARKRRNVDVVTGALAERVVIENARAVAVEATVNGVARRFACREEVIVSGGALESPLLLQRSGIGDADRLRSAGIEPLVQSPDVGERMIEHLAFAMPHRLREGRGSSGQLRGIGAVMAMLRWIVARKGIMATGPFEVGAFCNVAHPDGRTDAQIYMGGYTFAVGDDKNPVPLDKIDPRPGLTIYGQLLRLTSEASIRAGGPRACDTAVIEPNWLTTEHDRKSAVALVRFMRRMVHAGPLAGMIGEEVIPGAGVESDDAILDAFRKLASCGLHAIGSCRMGSDERAVVDPQLRVRGVSGLRVVDCSVMPGHVTGNTNAPAMALGYRAGALILDDRKG
ncbi:MAG: GMC family oxidoreductase [Novosphingobium sp.]